MPKILRIVNRLNVGGPTYNVGFLTKYLNPYYETLVVSGMKDDSEESSAFILSQLGISPTFIPNMHRALNPLRDLSAYRHIKQIIQDYKPDIVHTHAAKAGALGRMAAIDCGVPVVVHTFHGHVFHSYFNTLKTQVFIGIERYLAARSSQIIAISPQQKTELGDTYKICSSDKISVIPLGFDLSRFEERQAEKRAQFRQEYQIGENELAVAIVGRLTAIKNHTLFLDAFRQVLQETSRPVRAFIVGDGEDREMLEAHARNLSLPFSTPENPISNAPLIFTSWHKEVDKVYAGVDMVALSSLNEGTPVTLIEAQAANKPVVSTQVGGVVDVVLNRQTGLLSPSGDTRAFADNLAHLIQNDRLRHQLGSNSRARIAQQYSYTRLVSDMEQLYDRLLCQSLANYTSFYSQADATKPASPSLSKAYGKRKTSAAALVP